MQRCKVLVALLTLLSLILNVYAVGNGKFHPCRQQRPSVQKEKEFVVGFAFVANGDAGTLDWGSRENEPHPCSETDRELLTSAGVAISYFNVEVDKLTLLDTIDQLQQRYSKSVENITVIAFSGGYRSEARIVSIREGGTWKIIRSLALIAEFDENGLRQFRWFDLECGECFSGDSCLEFDKQTSCASECDLSQRRKCRTEIYISFDGVDKNKEVLNSASQIRRLRKASISHVYNSGRDLATDAVTSVLSEFRCQDECIQVEKF